MRKFKVGDKVRIVGPSNVGNFPDALYNPKIGIEAVIDKTDFSDEYPYHCERPEAPGFGLWYAESSLEAVSEQKPPVCCVCGQPLPEPAKPQYKKGDQVRVVSSEYEGDQNFHYLRIGSVATVKGIDGALIQVHGVTSGGDVCNQNVAMHHIEPLVLPEVE